MNKPANAEGPARARTAGRPILPRNTAYSPVDLVINEAARRGMALKALATRVGCHPVVLSRMGRHANTSYDVVARCLKELGYELSAAPLAPAGRRARAA
jgi:hypothetical protein